MSLVPQVGIGVIILKNNKVLLGKRKNTHGNGHWGFAGGHLEFLESPEDCAVRETTEEAGIKISNPRVVAYTNDIFKNEDKHYITFYVLADHSEGEPSIQETDKCDEWQWFEWESLPRPLFLPIKNLLEQGYHPLQ
ncbi:MAG: NUDIX domain-containing protein [Candidatus Jacksonbacteria bacterium]|jgi:8-oxo-dGTP diphosphatase|nr:NUDIX domain-containing protein [Candidatus Jacksonbacteria bacterium]MBT6034804.1 NUDIX domain-containing protein [Candidatus Jacksonbacteria bacterium]MBT6301642.1 NUDIX domain-containing protein [Candidatus Jacksonbacteria bacterium]MBT6757469.1 NUDIX domain-containing protein [Candidatus Jacksonbacteria bacterium]MBT6955219.1 NUDIX domain-containing protein [Candidatus Jacksonbacteria bacterium]